MFSLSGFVKFPIYVELKYRLHCTGSERHISGMAVTQINLAKQVGERALLNKGIPLPT